jgi:hypothetical protein
MKITNEQTGLTYNRMDIYEIPLGERIGNIDDWLFKIHATMIQDGMLDQNYATIMPIETWIEFINSKTGRNHILNMMPQTQPPKISDGTIDTSGLKYMGFRVHYSDFLKDSILIVHNDAMKAWLKLTEKMVILNTKKAEYRWILENTEKDYKKAFNILLDYFDSISDEEQRKVHAKLQELGL